MQSADQVNRLYGSIYGFFPGPESALGFFEYSMIMGDNKIVKTKANNNRPIIRVRYSTSHAGHHAAPILNTRTVVTVLKLKIKTINLRLTVRAIRLIASRSFKRIPIK